MRQIPLTQGKFALVDDDMFDELSKYKWKVKKTKNTQYAMRVVLDGKKQIGIYMHRVVMGMDSNNPLFCDHKDMCGLNNQRSNLRECTRSQNAKNRRSRPNSTSPYLGVSLSTTKKDDKVWTYWASHIRFDGKQICIGYFKTEIEAARAYDKAALIHHKDFARLNFPESNSSTPQTQTI